MSYRIEKITKGHERHAFDCGEPSLNTYLYSFARQNTQKGISVTYVAVRDSSQRVLAYYSLASGQVACASLPPSEQRRLPRYPIPVVKLGRLATDLTEQGQGLGRLMLVDALKRALLIANHVGIYAVEVDALHDAARAFYQRFGFQALEDDPLHLYLSIKTIRQLFR